MLALKRLTISTKPETPHHYTLLSSDQSLLASHGEANNIDNSYKDF
jgi:hypothetical protein